MRTDKRLISQFKMGRNYSILRAKNQILPDESYTLYRCGTFIYFLITNQILTYTHVPGN